MGKRGEEGRRRRRRGRGEGEGNQCTSNKMFPVENKSIVWPWRSTWQLFPFACSILVPSIFSFSFKCQGFSTLWTFAFAVTLILTCRLDVCHSYSSIAHC